MPGEKTANSVTVGRMHIARMSYDDEDAMRILDEAAQYEICCTGNTERCGWYTDDETETHSADTVRAITPENLLVKNGHFFGCVLEYNHSYWTYHTTDDRQEPVSVTLNTKGGVLIEYTDHSTDNGDYTSRTYAHLEKKKK